MMRYRSSKTTPGVNRPWSMEPDDVSQPLVVVLGWPGEEASRVAPLLLPRAVSASDAWTCAPQEAQNLAPDGTVALQLEQSTSEF